MAASNLVLRTVYISPDVDDKLREQAFMRRTSKNDLIRRYIELGMKAAQEAGAVGSPGKVVVAKANAKSAKKAPAKSKAEQPSQGTAKAKTQGASVHGVAKVVAVRT